MIDYRFSAPLKIHDYLLVVRDSNRFASRADELSSLQLGLFGEIGDLFALVKKSRRDFLSSLDSASVSEEFGDALWYLFAIADSQAISESALAAGALKALGGFLGAPAPRRITGHATFRQIQGYIEAHAADDRNSIESLVRNLAGQVGALVDSSGRKNSLGSICDIFALLMLIAWRATLNFEKIVQSNIQKVHGRWPGSSKTRTPLFDAQCLPAEQLPRNIWVKFDERSVRGVNYVFISINGVSVGDRLTDNSHIPDDYRFHDVFHIAYAACLGWSPVLRSLLKVKRKSISQLDENEDGARAIIIEEGISTWIFNGAREHLFSEIDEVGFPYSMLKQISSFVKGYEVEVCQPWEWAGAILAGFKIFREIKIHRRGYVFADLDSRTVTFKKIDDVEENFRHQVVRRRSRKSKAK